MQSQIFPNPFNVETKIKINNNGFEPMKVQIYSIDGRMVRNDVTSDNEYVWRGDNETGQKLQPGIYICKVQADNELFTGKVILGN
jgi:flagellar hook assembly protein FlgD